MDYFNKICLGKEEEKAINVLTVFSISNKNDIKTFLK